MVRTISAILLPDVRESSFVKSTLSIKQCYKMDLDFTAGSYIFDWLTISIKASHAIRSIIMLKCCP